MGSKNISPENCRNHDCKINEMIGVSLGGWLARSSRNLFFLIVAAVWRHLVAVIHSDFNIARGQFWAIPLVGTSRRVAVILGFFWLVSIISVA